MPNGRENCLVGNVKTRDFYWSEGRANEFGEKLEALMVEYGVTKIDIALDPYDFMEKYGKEEEDG